MVIVEFMNYAKIKVDYLLKDRESSLHNGIKILHILIY